MIFYALKYFYALNIRKPCFKKVLWNESFVLKAAQDITQGPMSFPAWGEEFSHLFSVCLQHPSEERIIYPSYLIIRVWVGRRLFLFVLKVTHRTECRLCYVVDSMEPTEKIHVFVRLGVKYIDHGGEQWLISIYWCGGCLEKYTDHKVMGISKIYIE